VASQGRQGDLVIRLVLVENESLVRQGLRRLLELEPDLEILGEAADGEEALALVRRVRPDVVLLDVRMPKLDGVGVLQQLRASDFFPPCLVLTTFDDSNVLLQAVRAGAKGYLLKDVSIDQLAEAIRTVAAGGSFIQPAVTAGLMRELERIRGTGGDAVRSEPLTGRELEVLRLMAGGYSNREIGQALFVAERTVKNHVSSILAKLGARDRTHAVLKGLRERVL